MSNFIISLGVINIKMLFPLLYILINSFIAIHEDSYEYNEVSIFIERLSFSFGEMLIFFLAQIFKYPSHLSKKEKTHIKKYFIDYLIIFLISLFSTVEILTPYYILTINGNDKEINEDAYKHGELFLNYSIYIILVTLITWLFLKYKYYIQHVISLIILVILSIIIDIVLENFKNMNITLITTSILSILKSSILYTYFKYLIERKYYYFMDILYTKGIFELVLFILSLSLILIVQKINGTDKLIFQFYEFYKNHGSWKMTSIFLVELIPSGFIIGLLEFKILDELGPNFVAITFLIGKIPSIIILINNYKKWIVLVISIFQIVFILFYLEILEYNFCSLNKNTKKNISKRELKQENDEDNDNDIDIKGYDISESIKTQEKIEKLNEMNEIFDEKEN